MDRAELTQRRSGPVRYELIDKDGNVSAETFNSAGAAAWWAWSLWPDQSQDPDRRGIGWDIEIVPKEGVN